MAERLRIDALARRVQWLDRYRHLLAVVVALVVTPVAIAGLSATVALDWRVVQVVLGVAAGTLVWAAAEVAFAVLVTAWEVRLAREVRLPPARLVKG